MIEKIVRKYRMLFWSCEKIAKYKGVVIGKGCLISTKNFPAEAYLISIGDYCRIAKGVSFFTHGGIWSQRKKSDENFDYFGKITIGNYTYVGEGAKIMPGVTLGDDVIIGAGSVVTKSIADGKVAAGNPARVVGETLDFVERIKNHDLGTKGKGYKEKKEFLLHLSEDKFIKK